MVNSTPNYNDTTFFGLWKYDKLEPFCFPFWFSIIVLVICYSLDYHYFNFQIALNIFNFKTELFGIAVSSLGINLGALAIVLILYNEDVKKLAFKNGSYQQFLFPYYINAYSWTYLSIITLLTIIFDNATFNDEFIDILRTVSYLILFFTIYSILYTIRIIGSIISNSILDIFSSK